jgi:hypothetical protein
MVIQHDLVVAMVRPTDIHDTHVVEDVTGGELLVHQFFRFSA